MNGWEEEEGESEELGDNQRGVINGNAGLCYING